MRRFFHHKRGSKNYDNQCSTPTAVVASRLVNQLSSDARERASARLIARRAGSFLRSISTLALGTPMFYKGDVFYSLWQGHTYIELYHITGDRSWLKMATKYVDTAIAPYQLPSGSWTWIRPDGSKFGESNRRDDRSSMVFRWPAAIIYISWAAAGRMRCAKLRQY